MESSRTGPIGEFTARRARRVVDDLDRDLLAAGNPTLSDLFGPSSAFLLVQSVYTAALHDLTVVYGLVDTNRLVMVAESEA